MMLERAWPLSISVGVFLTGFALHAEAFTADEHRQLTDMSFALAKESACTENDHAWCTFVDTALDAPCSPEDERAALARLGDLTVAVDHRRKPQKLLPAPPSGCPGAASCDVRWLTDLARQIEVRWLTRQLAAHRNAAHFQAGAVDAYEEWHAKARRAAIEGDHHKATLSEAIALHFLQDFLASGHFLTGRAGLADAPAGGLHERYNLRGVDFQTADSAPWSDLLGVVAPEEKQRAIGAASCPKRGSRRLPIDFEFPAAAARVWRFRGDGMLEETPEQVGFLVFIGARSILDALDVEEKDRPHGQADLQLCFKPKTAEAVDEAKAGLPACPDCEPPDYSTYRFHHCSVTAPWAAIMLDAPRGGECWLDRSGVLGEWVTWNIRLECPDDRDPRGSTFSEERCDPSDLCLATAASLSFAGGAVLRDEMLGGRFTLGVPFGLEANNQILRRDAHGNLLTGPSFYEGRGTFFGTLRVVYELWEGYQGAGGEYAPEWIVPLRKGHLDLLLGGHLGWRRLWNSANGTTRFVYGLHGGFGLGILFVQLDIERGYHLEPTGRAQLATNHGVAVRLDLSPWWFVKLTRALRRDSAEGSGARVARERRDR